MKNLNKIFILLFEIGFGITFNIIGIISVSEIFLVIALPFYLKSKLYREYSELKKITFLYVGLLIAQILSEIFVSSGMNNSMRGLAITIVSYLHFIFLFRYFVKNPALILYLLLGILARLLIFGSKTEETITEVLEGTGERLLKFYVVYYISSGLLIGSLFIKQRHVALIAVIIGSVIVLLGARSGGSILAFAGIVTYTIIVSTRRITSRQFITTAIIAITIGYGGFIIYATNVLNGNITSGNSKQLLQSKNPYNPLNLLMIGRSEVFIGMQAFADAPLLGHGAWSPDPNFKYHSMQLELTNSDRDIKSIYMHTINIIPVHSVIIGSGVYNGISAFIFMVAIFYFFIRRGISTVNKNNVYLFIIISFLVTLLWNSLFSPQSHFRLDMPPYFAFLFAIYSIKNKRKSHKNMSCNHQ
jgi:hypothetical protein